MKEQALKIGELVQVQAPSPRQSLAGSALCQREGAPPEEVIEVPQLWPGESASVRLLARSRHQPRYFAKVHTLVQAHPERIEAPCEHHPEREAKPACGGCPWMTLSVPAQRQVKTELLSAQFGRPLELIQGDEGQGYRHASKRVVARVRGRLSLGSYVPRSHQLAPMTRCVVDHPLLAHAFERCEALFIEHRVAPYDEQSQEGEVRYVWGKCSDHGVHLTIIGAQDKSPRLLSALEALAKELGPGNAVSFQRHEGPGNAMRSLAATERIDPYDTLPQMELLGQTVELDALGFLQPNPAVAQRCYRALLGLDEDPAPSGTLALDLYAGSGVTSLVLAERFSTVMACEQRPPDGAASMVRAQSVEDFLGDFDPALHGTPDFVVANPPRAGLSESACTRVIEIQPPRVAIMSCGPQGLANNLRQLGAAGYELVSLQGFDPLAHTAHVELVAHLRKTT